MFSSVALGVINDLFMVADSGDRIILVYRKTFDTFDQGHSNQQIKTSGWVDPFGRWSTPVMVSLYLTTSTNSKRQW